MRRLTIIILALIALFFVIAAGVWYFRPGQLMQLARPPEINGQTRPVIVGAIVAINDDRTSMTIKAADGTSKTFKVPEKMPIYTLATSTQMPKVANALSAGDIVAVFADSTDSNTAAKFEVIPLEVPLQSSTTLETKLISKTNSSITIAAPLPAGMPDTGAKLTLAVTKNTLVLTEITNGQSALTYDAIAPGSKLRIIVNMLPTPAAQIIEVLAQ